MEHKSNSYKVNRQQREKVLRFSIRKYSFGAASVAVAALMFLSGHQAVRVEAAQVSDTTEAPVIPDKEEAHTATIVDLPKTEDSLTTDKEENHQAQLRIRLRLYLRNCLKLQLRMHLKTRLLPLIKK